MPQVCWDLRQMGPKGLNGVEVCFLQGLVMEPQGIHARVKVLTVPPWRGQGQRLMGNPENLSGTSIPASHGQHRSSQFSVIGALMGFSQEGREGKENRVANQRPGGKGGAPSRTRGWDGTSEVRVRIKNALGILGEGDAPK